MPIVPPPVTYPYDSVLTVLTAAQVRLNDAIQGLNVSDSATSTNQPYVQVACNTAWRSMQDFLRNLGADKFTPEVILFGLPPVTSVDPASQVWLDWTSYFDGNSYWTPPNTPVLPAGFEYPLKLWERPSGQNCSFGYPMLLYIDGLPTCSKVMANRYWEWRQDAIYMPGSQRTMDLRIRYRGFYPDFVTTGPTQWYQQPVPIVNCLDALSNYMASEISDARGDADGATFLARGQEAARILFNRDVQRKQRSNISRIPRSAGAHSGYDNF